MYHPAAFGAGKKPLRKENGGREIGQTLQPRGVPHKTGPHPTLPPHPPRERIERESLIAVAQALKSPPPLRLIQLHFESSSTTRSCYISTRSRRFPPRFPLSFFVLCAALLFTPSPSLRKAPFPP